MEKTITFRFASTIPWYALVPVAVALALLAVRLYRTERSLVSGPMGKALTVLRALLPILLLLMLLEPLFTTHWFEDLKGRVILLLDSSLSMKSTDEARPDEEKVRLLDSLKMLPKGARDVSYEKLAVRALADALKAAKAVEVGKALDKLSTKRSVKDYKRKHKAAFSTLEDFHEDLEDLAEDDDRPAEIAGPLKEHANKLKDHIEAHEKLEDDVLDELVESPQEATRGAAYDRESSGLLAEAGALLIAGQQTSDRLLARSDDKAIRKAIEKLDEMKRSELMGRLLQHDGEGILPRLGKRFHLECYKLAGHEVVDHDPRKVVRSSGKLTFDTDGKVTNLAEALRSAAELTKSGRETAAVVLLSDGQNNSGGDPEMAAKILAGRNVPLFTIGIGSGEPPKDIAIAELDTSRVIYLGDEVHVGVAIKYDGFEGASAPLRIEEADEVVTERRVPFPEGRRRTHEDLAFVPEEVGPHKYSVVIPVQGGELIEENNRREFKLEVIDDKIRVLYVEGEPRWEYRFLKNLLLRDRTMELNRIMLTRDAPELPRGARYGQFPDSREELFRYDVLILGDVPADRFFPSELKNIEAFAAENGGAVVIICGPMFNPESYAGTPVSEMLPIFAERVVPSDEVKRKIQYSGFRPVLTHEGEISPITRIAFDKRDNALIWENLAPLHWHAFLARAKPGAEVLLRAPGREDDDCVLLATQNYGMGKALLLGTDDSWRWRWKVGDKYFHKFWGQVMRWATAGKSAGRDRYIRMGAQKPSYEEGEPVELQAKVLGTDLKPLRDASVAAVLEREDEQVDIVPLEFIKGSEGRYRGRFLGLEKGHYTIRLNVPDLPQNPSEAHVEIDVADRPDLEQVELFLNQPLLESMAKITGGRYYDAEDSRKLYDAIEPTKKRIPRVEEILLWTWPGFLLLFTLIVCAEWALRKKSGLL